VSASDGRHLTPGPGLYTSPLASTTTPEVVAKPSLIPYPPAPGSTQPGFNRSPAAPEATPIPINVAISQWHWILLYTDRIVGIARETEKVVFEERISLVSSSCYSPFMDLIEPQGIDEKVLGLSADPVSRTFWVFTDRSILEVLVRNEDRDVWRAKLEKGEYNDALQYATVCHNPLSSHGALTLDPRSTRCRTVQTGGLAFRPTPVHSRRSMLCQMQPKLRVRCPAFRRRRGARCFADIPLGPLRSARSKGKPLGPAKLICRRRHKG
jgi:hypothetical protein